MNPRYELRNDVNGQYYWRSIASNGKQIGRSSESYVRKADAVHSIELQKAMGSGTQVFDHTTANRVVNEAIRSAVRR